MPPVKERALSNFFSPSQNHLILIVGLIALACVISGLALSFASASLDSAQRWLLLAFLILFPIVGLTASLWLILRHHRKLTVSAGDEEIEWTLTTPGQQKNKLNEEVIELAATLGIPKTQISDLRSAYIVAEDLAMRKIESEIGSPVKRHISIGDAMFDGIVVEHDLVTCIDVVFLVRPDISQDKLNSIVNKAGYSSRKLQEWRPGSQLKLLLAVVTQLSSEEEEAMRSLLIEKFGQTAVHLASVKLMDFEELQRTFAAD
jgi:hypothetical protein